MAALVVNLIVLAGFVMNNWYQEAQKTQDQGLTKVSADVADRHYVMPVECRWGFIFIRRV